MNHPHRKPRRDRSAGLLVAVLVVGGCSPARPEPSPGPPGASQGREAADVTSLAVAYRVPGMDDVRVGLDEPYRTIGEEPLTFDIYRPAGSEKAARRPAVILIHGGPIGPKDSPQKWGVYRSYGRLLAASGFVGLAFKHRLYAGDRYGDSADDLEALLRHVRDHADELGIDPARLALWAFSAGGPILAAALDEPDPPIRCLVSFYAPASLEDAPGDLFRVPIPDATAARFSLARRLADRPGPFPPILIARAGRDFPWINRSVDAFVRAALDRGVALDLMNHPEGGHAFDIQGEDQRTREIIGRTIGFLGEHLR